MIRNGYGTVGTDRDAIWTFNSETTRYRNGSKIKTLAASPTSVRGPHVPSLKLDEVDEIDPDIRESAMGMVMAMRGTPAFRPHDIDVAQSRRSNGRPDGVAGSPAPSPFRRGACSRCSNAAPRSDPGPTSRTVPNARS